MTRSIRSGYSESSKSDDYGEVSDSRSLYTLHINVPLWGDTTVIKNINPDRTTVLQLKTLIEVLVGVPHQTQRLCYLDASDLENHIQLSSLDIVNFATLTVYFWPKWRQLFRYVADMDIPGLLKCNITPKTIEPAQPTVKKHIPLKQSEGDPGFEQLKKKRNACIYLASNRADTGVKIEFVGKLLDLGFDVNGELESGYRPIHTAVATGRYKCIDFLLKKGAVFDMKKSCGQHALEIAKEYGHTQSERHLFLYEWGERAQRVKPRPHPKLRDRMQHQQFDSGNPTWIDGIYGTRYMASTLPTLEFAGTRINSKPIIEKKAKRDTESRINVPKMLKGPREKDLAFEWNMHSFGVTPSPDVDEAVADRLRSGGQMASRAGASSAATFEFKPKKLQRERAKLARKDAANQEMQTAQTALKPPPTENEEQAYITTERKVVTWDNMGHAHYDTITKKIIKYEDFDLSWPDYERRILEKYFSNKIPTV